MEQYVYNLISTALLSMNLNLPTVTILHSRVWLTLLLTIRQIVY